MTPFATLRHRIGWSVAHIAARLAMSERQVWRWDSGPDEPPQRVLDYLDAVGRAVDAVPVPQRPNVRRNNLGAAHYPA